MREPCRRVESPDRLKLLRNLGGFLPARRSPGSVPACGLGAAGWLQVEAAPNGRGPKEPLEWLAWRKDRRREEHELLLDVMRKQV